MTHDHRYASHFPAGTKQNIWHPASENAVIWLYCQSDFPFPLSLSLNVCNKSYLMFLCSIITLKIRTFAPLANKPVLASNTSHTVPENLHKMFCLSCSSHYSSILTCLLKFNEWCFSGAIIVLSSLYVSFRKVFCLIFFYSVIIANHISLQNINESLWAGWQLNKPKNKHLQTTAWR